MEQSAAVTTPLPVQSPASVNGKPRRSRAKEIGRLDQRTCEARLLRQITAELTAHVGGEPSATQAALIRQAAQLSLRLRRMDEKFASGSDEISTHASKVYLAWAGSLARTMKLIGLKGATPPPRQTYQDYIASSAARSAATSAASELL